MRAAGPDPARPTRGVTSDDGLVGFLTDRLHEDLARLWERDTVATVTRPGLAAQVAIVDELLTTLRSGLLPPRRELRMLLYGYGTHPAYDPAWTRRLSGRD